MDLVKLAEEIATEAHSGQQRKHSGEPYIEHPRRVATLCDTPQTKAVAWLHDVLEDTEWTVDRLIAHGIPKEYVAIVVLITKQSWDSYTSYIKRLQLNDITKRVKIYDLLDNLRDLPKGTLRDKYELALELITS